MSKEIVLNDRLKIGCDNPCLIIAEIGQNHQGDINIAKKLIDLAKECHAHCVKFQMTNLNEKFTKRALEQAYLSRNSFGETYGEHKQHLNFSIEQFIELKQYCETLGIVFCCTPMDEKSLEILVGPKFQVPFIKIGSGDINNLPLIKKAAKSGLPLIISTGMANIQTVDRVYNLVEQTGNNQLVLMHCVSSYPIPDLKQIDLNVITSYKQQFKKAHIGYSSHEMNTDNHEVVLGAVSLGARVIERHITLSNEMKGSDHKCSLNPEQFKQMVESIQNLQLALHGDGIKKIQNCELECIQKLKKTIVLSKNLKKDHILTMDDLKVKVDRQPHKGIDPIHIDSIFGKKLTNNKQIDDVLEIDDLEL